MVLIHGGFWRWPINRWVTALLARDAARRGFTVFNVEYRRLGRFGGGGGWPETFDDIADALAVTAERFERAPIVLVGHSAGGHLALVTAARYSELVDGVVSMSAPTDLRTLSANGSAPIDALVAGAPTADRWSLTSPIEMLPIGVPTVCTHGDGDVTVDPAMSIDYVRAARLAGDDARLVVAERERHRSALSPRSASWRAALASVEAWTANHKESSRADRCVTIGQG